MALRPIYYDTETTGIRPEKDRIIEIAAYDPLNKASFVQFIHPGIPIPAEASTIHGITDLMVADADGFPVVINKFIDFCGADAVLIAHNNDAFDIHFLRNEFERSNISFPGHWKFFDSLKWARKYRKDLPKHPLQFLRETYGIPANNAHRALDDVMVLHQVCSYLLGDLTIETALKLLEEIKEPKEIQHMPFGKHQGTPLAKVPSSYIRWLADNGALDKEENLTLKSAFIKLGMLTS